MTPRLKQRLGGLFIALLGAGGTALVWYTAVGRGEFFEKASMVFPAFLVLGVALIIFPGYREERIARGEDISRLQGWQLLTPRWRWILVVGILVGLGNYFLLDWAFG